MEVRSPGRLDLELIESFPGCIHVVDAGGRVIALNHDAQRACGVTAQSAQGHDYVELFCEGRRLDESGAYTSPLLETLETGQEFRDERAWLTLRGKRGYFLYSTRVLKGPDGIQGAALLMYDQTVHELAWEEARGLIQKQLAVLRASHNITVEGLALLAEHRDPTIHGHLARIRHDTRLIAQQMSTMRDFEGIIDSNFLDAIDQSCILHDVGKVGIPEGILLKPGRLTPAEFTVMKEHTTIGAALIAHLDEKLQAAVGEPYTFLTMAKEIAFCHHEHWDGRGYPEGLAGENIPLSARIVAVADVYDALISPRVYKSAFPLDKAREIVLAGEGNHFDPRVVEAFLAVEGRLAQPDNINLP